MAEVAGGVATGPAAILSGLSGVFKEIAGLIGIQANPTAFAVVVIVLIFSAFLLFWNSSDKIKLTAFAILVVASSGTLVGVFVQPYTVRPAEPKPVEPDAPSPSGTPGWAYYEVGKDGHLTDDGQLKIYRNNAPFPDFLSIKSGVVLQANSAVRIRSTPPTSNKSILNEPPISVLKASQCVVTTADASQNYSTPVKEARSGGWLPVKVTPCPAV